MEQDVDKQYRKVCNTCLSSDRDLMIFEEHTEVFQIFRLLMFDFAGELDPLSDHIQLCWECTAIMRKFNKFKKRVHAAQVNLQVLTTSGSQEIVDHTYLSQCLSSLESISKRGYDKIYFDHTTKILTEWSPQYIAISTTDNVKNESYDIAQAVRENINLELEENILGGITLENATTVPHIVINAEPLVSQEVYKHTEFVLPELTISTMDKANTLLDDEQKDGTGDKPDLKAGYITEYMNEEDMLAFREEAKEKIQYASAVYKCELCIVGFYNQQQVKEHYVSAHKARPGTVACKICFVFVEEDKQSQHLQSHYVRHVCRMCGHAEGSAQLAQVHVHSHLDRKTPRSLIKIGDAALEKKSRKRKQKEESSPSSNTEPQNLRKLLSKTTIVGYKCLECDMFFKNSRARKNHVARFHREGLQCDHCKKRFVNKTTLATHLKLHEGPPPREECPVCHKMVRVIQLKYHVQRHQSKGRYECADCCKLFSHLTTYHAHLKYSRAHASDQVFKFPCPMCNKGYPTKEAMQDHFNYQHLGKTSHKCPICDKPIASRANVEKHMMRVHGEKKEKPRNHVCQQCGKGFTDKKALNQHEVIHSGERPLSCDICHQTFKQKASLYTHKKRVHNVVPIRRVVEFIDTKSNT
ncbi:zinc finger protein 58-like [Battus philenor]|uniref:zinc finger protein 58-like n=1 Tax=Battus philenor TaxID=42288 RepID=UPI0035CF6DD0